MGSWICVALQQSLRGIVSRTTLSLMLCVENKLKLRLQMFSSLFLSQCPFLPPLFVLQIKQVQQHAAKKDNIFLS